MVSDVVAKRDNIYISSLWHRSYCILFFARSLRFIVDYMF